LMDLAQILGPAGRSLQHYTIHCYRCAYRLPIYVYMCRAHPWFAQLHEPCPRNKAQTWPIIVGCPRAADYPATLNVSSGTKHRTPKSATAPSSHLSLVYSRVPTSTLHSNPPIGNRTPTSSSPHVHHHHIPPHNMSRRPNPAADRAEQNRATLKNLVKLEGNKTCSDCKRNKRTLLPPYHPGRPVSVYV
jgi:hypothetical protein